MEPIPAVSIRSRRRSLRLRLRLRPSRSFRLSLIALRTAALGAVGTAGGLYLADHRDFNPFDPQNWTRLLSAVAVPALGAVFAHFAHSPAHSPYGTVRGGGSAAPSEGPHDPLPDPNDSEDD